VGVVRFSRRAEADLIAIAEYTLRTWGYDQALSYLDDLETACKKVAANPELGRRYDEIRKGLRRIEEGRHVIFYRSEVGGVLVSRILHQRMLPERHVIDEDTDFV
jgi:toxin ParE1/3/4